MLRQGNIVTDKILARSIHFEQKNVEKTLTQLWGNLGGTLPPPKNMEMLSL
jgi:hypothetical protein